MYEFTDPLYGLPQETIKELLNASGLGSFIPRQYDCEKDGHMIIVTGNIENEEDKVFADFSMKIYGTGHLIYVRSTKTEYILNEETLSQKEQTIIHEAEIKNGFDGQTTTVTVSNTEDEILEKYTLINGEKQETE
jgi:hypothetical protein